MRKTTDIRTMKKIVSEYIQYKKDLLPLCVEYWNELANSYFIEYEELNFNGSYYENGEKSLEVYNIDDLVLECIYWLSCYYENGNIRHDEEYNDRKAFIKFLTVFIPYSSLDYSDNMKRLEIPCNKETEILFVETEKNLSYTEYTEPKTEEEETEEETEEEETEEIHFTYSLGYANTKIKDINENNFVIGYFYINNTQYTVRLFSNFPKYLNFSNDKNTKETNLINWNKEIKSDNTSYFELTVSQFFHQIENFYKVTIEN